MPDVASSLDSLGVEAERSLPVSLLWGAARCPRPVVLAVGHSPVLPAGGPPLPAAEAVRHDRRVGWTDVSD